MVNEVGRGLVKDSIFRVAWSIMMLYFVYLLSEWGATIALSAWLLTFPVLVGLAFLTIKVLPEGVSRMLFYWSWVALIFSPWITIVLVTESQALQKKKSIF